MTYCDLFHSFIRYLLSIKSRLMHPSRALRVKLACHWACYPFNISYVKCIHTLGI